MKKYIKATLIVHVLMVSAFFALALGTDRSEERRPKEGEILGEALEHWGRGLAIVSAYGAGTVAAYTAVTMVPIVGPVVAALEYFDVIDIGDWFDEINSWW